MKRRIAWVVTLVLAAMLLGGTAYAKGVIAGPKSIDKPTIQPGELVLIEGVRALKPGE